MMGKFYETWHNREHIKAHRRRDFLVFELDTKHITYRVGSNRVPWRELGSFYKRKLENLLVIEFSMERCKFIYNV